MLILAWPVDEGRQAPEVQGHSAVSQGTLGRAAGGKHYLLFTGKHRFKKTIAPTMSQTFSVSGFEAAKGSPGTERTMAIPLDSG